MIVSPICQAEVSIIYHATAETDLLKEEDLFQIDRLTGEIKLVKSVDTRLINQQVNIKVKSVVMQNLVAEISLIVNYRADDSFNPKPKLENEL